MEDRGFEPRRLTREYRQTIQALPEKVFPLLCPVREADWLDGWRYSMVFSESGLVEEGAVFRTPLAGEEDTVFKDRPTVSQRVISRWGRHVDPFLFQ